MVKRKRKYTTKWGRPLKKRKTSFKLRRNRRTGGFLDKELKYMDQTHFKLSTDTTLTSAQANSDPSTAACLNAVAQGDAQNQRNGNKIIVKSLQINGFIVPKPLSAQASANRGVIFRMIVYLDKQTNGSQNPANQLITTGTYLVNSVRNLEWSNRFRVLADTRIPITWDNSFNDAGTTGTEGGPAVPFNIFKKMNLPVQFKGTGATIADIIDNSLHILFVSTLGDVEFYYTSRIRYVG